MRVALPIFSEFCAAYAYVLGSVHQRLLQGPEAPEEQHSVPEGVSGLHRQEDSQQPHV